MMNDHARQTHVLLGMTTRKCVSKIKHLILVFDENRVDAFYLMLPSNTLAFVYDNAEYETE